MECGKRQRCDSIYFDRYEFICFESYRPTNFDKSLAEIKYRVGRYKGHWLASDKICLNVIPKFLQNAKINLKLH